MCVQVFSAINSWVTESDFYSDFYHQVVVPEHVDLWKVADTDVPVTVLKW